MWGSQNWSFSRESVPITSRIVASCASDHHSLGVRHCCWDGLETDRYRADPAAGTSVPHQTCGLREAPPPPFPAPTCPSNLILSHRAGRPLPLMSRPSDRHETDSGDIGQTRERPHGQRESGQTGEILDRQKESGQTGERLDRQRESGQTEERLDRQGEWTDRGETGQTGGRMDRERRDMGESGQTMDRLT